MDIRPRITIDLTAFGKEGAITLAPPTFRRTQELSNRLAVIGQGGEIVKVSPGEAYVLSVLSYVEKGPFGLDYDEFMDYCDELDELRLGSAKELFSAMEKAVRELDTKVVSPFAGSPSAGIANSV